MVTINYKGRLANNIIQFIASYFFSKKNNLTLKSYPPRELNKQVILPIGRDGSDLVKINDNNFFDFYDKDYVEEKYYLIDGYFQTKRFLEPIREEVKNLFNFEYEKKSDDEVFVHYRIGDLLNVNSNFVIPVEYYIEALETINFTSGYISSDSIEDERCKELINKFNLKPIQLSPIDTILFGKNFNKLVLSEGSFSLLIGYFSNAKTIISNDRPLKWGGDACNGFDNYTKLSWGYDNNNNPIKLKF